MFTNSASPTRPYLDFITPTGAKPGTTAEITFYGLNLPGGENADVQMNGRSLEKVVRKVEVPSGTEATTSLNYGELLRPPASRVDGMEVRVTGESRTSNPRLLTFSDYPEQAEVEPNDTIPAANLVPIPCAVTGAFSAPKDVDQFVFSGKKGEVFVIEVEAERIGSPAGPDMEIAEADGKIINSTQDTNENIGQLRFPTNTRDIVYTFTAPKDADFTLRPEHVYQQVQGGPQYQYRLTIQRQPPPDFRLVCSPPSDIRVDTHAVYQGGRQRLDILAWRINGLDTPIMVEARKLPPGVTAEPIIMCPGMKWGTLIVTAAPDAPVTEGGFEATTASSSTRSRRSPLGRTKAARHLSEQRDQDHGRKAREVVIPCDSP